MTQEPVQRMSHLLESVLEWSRTHPGATLHPLEAQVEKAMAPIRTQLLEVAVAQPGTGEFPQEPCPCGGRWVFQGYQEREGMTIQGNIRIRRASFTGDRRGAGISPLDQPLQMREGWSEGAVEQALWTAQAVRSYREAEEALRRLAHLDLSKSTIHRMVEQYGGALAARQQEEAKALWGSGVRGEEVPPPREGQKEAPGIGLDGVMVWVDDGWHEVKVGCCFELGPGRRGEVEAWRIGY